MEDLIARMRTLASMIRVYGFVLGVAAALLAGCAAGYQHEAFAGGYSERQFGENVFYVTFRGNAYTKKEQAADFSLLRSADVALNNGFKYFVIVEARTESNTGRYTALSPQFSVPLARGETFSGLLSIAPAAGSTFLISKFTATTTIRCFKEKPETEAPVADAETLARALREKYGLTE